MYLLEAPEMMLMAILILLDITEQMMFITLASEKDGKKTKWTATYSKEMDSKSKVLVQNQSYQIYMKTSQGYFKNLVFDLLMKIM